VLLDATTTAGGGVTVRGNTGGVNLGITADNSPVTLQSGTALMTLTSTNTTAEAIKLEATSTGAAAAIHLDSSGAGSAAVLLDATTTAGGGVTVRGNTGGVNVGIAADNSPVTLQSGTALMTLTSANTTASAIKIDATGVTGGIDIDSVVGTTIDASGTAAGSHALHVTQSGGTLGVSGSNALRVTGNALTSTDGGFENTPLYVTNGSTDTAAMPLTYSAFFAFDVGALNFRSLSDERAKTDIKSLDSEKCLEQVAALRPVSFHFKETKKRNPEAPHQEVGFIAQEVKKHIPELVGGDEEGEGMMNLNYAAMTANLTGAVQALLKRIESLEGEVAIQKKAMLAMQKLAHTGLKSVQQ